jgi:hypothetical protein
MIPIRWRPARLAEFAFSAFLLSPVLAGPAVTNAPQQGVAFTAPEPLERRADGLRPTQAEKLWEQIPWHASLVKAQEVARAEKRPLFVWTDDNNPFQRCWNAAFGFRVGPLSNSQVVALISSRFVPAATDLRLKGRTTGQGEYLDTAAETRLQRSWQIDRYRPIGVHVLTPEGRLLASAKAPATTTEFLAFLNGALQQSGSVSPRNARPTSILPDEGRGLRADGSIRLAVAVRALANGQPTGKGPIRDNLLLSAADLRALLPTGIQSGQKFMVADTTARRFALLLSDGPDPVYAIRPQDVTSGQLQAHVVKATGEGGEIRFRGNLAGVRGGSGNSQPFGGETVLEGYLTFNAQRKPVRLLVVASGGFRMSWQKDYHDIGALAEWKVGNGQ